MHARPLSAVLCIVVALAACAQRGDEQELFTARLTGADAVPRVATEAGGTAGFVVQDGVLQYAVEIDRMAGATAAHIHTGAPGTNGVLRVVLFSGLVNRFVVEHQLAAGTIGDAQVSGMGVADLLRQMRSGTAYVDVHTQAHPDGEVRGPIELVR